jgi:hypothetical protein
MQGKTKLVSVIVPAYNASAFIEESLLMTGLPMERQGSADHSMIKGSGSSAR